MSMAMSNSATTGAGSPMGGPGDANRDDLHNGEGVGARERPRCPLGDNDLGRCMSTVRCMFDGGPGGGGADPQRGEGSTGGGDGNSTPGGRRWHGMLDLS